MLSELDLCKIVFIVFTRIKMLLVNKFIAAFTTSLTSKTH